MTFGGPNHLRPFFYPFQSWRTISYPFYSLPAWWFVGIGFNALFASRRPRWWTLLIGTALCAAFLTLLLGFRFRVPPEDRTSDAWLLWGTGLWALLFAVFPFAWLRRITRPRASLSDAIAAPAEKNVQP